MGFDMTPTVTTTLASATYTAMHPLVADGGMVGLCAGVGFVLLATLIAVLGASRIRPHHQ